MGTSKFLPEVASRRQGNWKQAQQAALLLLRLSSFVADSCTPMHCLGGANMKLKLTSIPCAAVSHVFFCDGRLWNTKQLHVTAPRCSSQRQ